MKFIPKFLRRLVHVQRLKARFPLSVIYPGVLVDRDSTLKNYSVLFKNALLYKTSLGAYSYVQENTAIYSADVGPFCSIARNITIGLFVHPTSMVSTSPIFYDCTQQLPRFFVKENLFQQEMLRTVIGPDVWIGEGAKVKAGVRIGVGAVIGAGSVVTRDVAPYTIAAGVPCRPIKKRFEEAICDRLLKSAWWLLDEDELISLSPSFSDPVAFLDAIEKI